jgi:putative oxidoreductase
LLTWMNRLEPAATLVMRVILGTIMVGYGYQKVIPHGALDHFVHYVRGLGLPYWLAYVSAFTEFFGGMLLIVGVLTRFIALALLIDMAVALKANWHGGLTGPNSLSLPLACLAVALMLMATGAGPLGLDGASGAGGGGSSRRKAAAR